jgi:hypothetical protein
MSWHHFKELPAPLAGANAPGQCPGDTLLPGFPGKGLQMSEKKPKPARNINLFFQTPGPPHSAGPYPPFGTTKMKGFLLTTMHVIIKIQQKNQIG